MRVFYATTPTCFYFELFSNMLINMIREPQGSANIFSNNGQNGLLGSILTWENSEEAGDNSVSDVDILIFSLLT